MHPVLFHIGKVTLYSYGFMIAVGGSLPELLDGDDRGSVPGGLLSTTRAISIPLAGISVMMFLYLRGRGTKRHVRR
jgi:prolipoprotein diacylglyceryltransferase